MYIDSERRCRKNETFLFFFCCFHSSLSQFKKISIERKREFSGLMGVGAFSLAPVYGDGNITTVIAMKKRVTNLSSILVMHIAHSMPDDQFCCMYMRWANIKLYLRARVSRIRIEDKKGSLFSQSPSVGCQLLVHSDTAALHFHFSFVLAVVWSIRKREKKTFLIFCS